MKPRVILGKLDGCGRRVLKRLHHGILTPVIERNVGGKIMHFEHPWLKRRHMKSIGHRKQSEKAGSVKRSRKGSHKSSHKASRKSTRKSSKRGGEVKAPTQAKVMKKLDQNIVSDAVRKAFVF